MFGRRRWRMPWSSGTSGTSGEPWSPEPVRVRWAEPSLPSAEPNVHTSDHPSSGAQMTSEAPSEAPSGPMSSSTVKVIPPGVTATAGTGTAPSRTGGPGATPSQPEARPAQPGGPPRSTGSPRPWGSPGSADAQRTRVIRIPASIGLGHPDSAPAVGGAARTRRRSRSASTAREEASADAPSWEKVRSDGPGRAMPVVIAVVLVCALLGGLAAFAATLSESAPAGPDPAASIAPAGATAPGGRAGTGVSGAGAKPTSGGHASSGPGDSRRGSASPPPIPSRSTPPGPTAKPTAKPSAKPTAKPIAKRRRA